MATVMKRTPLWLQMLRDWRGVESACCLFAEPCFVRITHICGWCGREFVSPEMRDY
jgi:hypothetical protein